MASSSKRCQASDLERAISSLLCELRRPGVRVPQSALLRRRSACADDRVSRSTQLLWLHLPQPGDLLRHRDRSTSHEIDEQAHGFEPDLTWCLRKFSNDFGRLRCEIRGFRDSYITNRVTRPRSKKMCACNLLKRLRIWLLRLDSNQQPSG